MTLHNDTIKVIVKNEITEPHIIHMIDECVTQLDEEKRMNVHNVTMFVKYWDCFSSKSGTWFDNNTSYSFDHTNNNIMDGQLFNLANIVTYYNEFMNEIAPNYAYDVIMAL